VRFDEKHVYKNDYNFLTSISNCSQHPKCRSTLNVLHSGTVTINIAIMHLNSQIMQLSLLTLNSKPWEMTVISTRHWQWVVYWETDMSTRQWETNEHGHWKTNRHIYLTVRDRWTWLLRDRHVYLTLRDRQTCLVRDRHMSSGQWETDEHVWWQIDRHVYLTVLTVRNRQTCLVRARQTCLPDGERRTCLVRETEMSTWQWETDEHV